MDGEDNSQTATPFKQCIERIGGEDAFEGGGDIDLIMATLGPWSCLGTDVRPLEVRMASE